MVVVKYMKLKEDAMFPTRATEYDAGSDIRANERIVLKPHGLAKVPIGLAVEVPEGYELQIRGKSGLALSEGLSIAQGVGTIDSGYREEVCVLIKNIKPYLKVINKGEVVAQLVLNKLPEVEWKEVKSLSSLESSKKEKEKTTEQVSKEDKKE